MRGLLLFLSTFCLAACTPSRPTGVLSTSAIGGRPFDPLEPCLRVGRVVKGARDTLKVSWLTDSIPVPLTLTQQLTLWADSVEAAEGLLLAGRALVKGGDTVALVADYDGLRQLLSLNLSTRDSHRAFSFTWDDATANLQEIRGHYTQGDEERQEVITLRYDPHSAFSNWSSGLVRHLVGQPLEALFYSGLLGRASWWLPTAVSYRTIRAKNGRIQESRTASDTITYLKDCHGLVIEEHFSDPFTSMTDYCYTY